MIKLGTRSSVAPITWEYLVVGVFHINMQRPVKGYYENNDVSKQDFADKTISMAGAIPEDAGRIP